MCVIETKREIVCVKIEKEIEKENAFDVVASDKSFKILIRI
jgi:hypothetical protein